ncbi:hypothetical protein PPL_04787 [Heterostelium album PN500]|uniref:J domain-containing protein n=1 Tax=Heterostelium pallidum (strain ATCC 26659 / Pp 5 / PN500) TaxID=670386 RepID=D3B8J4_HETP5|nr:hypothetical protein PPL_04787 [Heterostelium album PN500]EFA82362.1 hypothetical protein PPL_04787 [Heterostelium album PN500]|eukprot:XP_020434479.1 hypothetical protein PPL_04787 [Heterostelium album PN500]
MFNLKTDQQRESTERERDQREKIEIEQVGNCISKRLEKERIERMNMEIEINRQKMEIQNLSNQLAKERQEREHIDNERQKLKELKEEPDKESGEIELKRKELIEIIEKAKRPEDIFKINQSSSESREAQLVKRYRNISKVIHPDKCKGIPEIYLVKATEAYKILNGELLLTLKIKTVKHVLHKAFAKRGFNC